MANRYLPICALLGIVLLGLTSAAARASDDAETLSTTPADLAAAFLVAYGDYSKVTAGDPEPLTVAEFPKRFEKVSLRRNGESAVVRFYPPYREHTTGGSVLYVVNLKTLAVSDRIFGR